MVSHLANANYASSISFVNHELLVAKIAPMLKKNKLRHGHIWDRNAQTCTHPQTESMPANLLNICKRTQF